MVARGRSKARGSIMTGWDGSGRDIDHPLTPVSNNTNKKGVGGAMSWWRTDRDNGDTLASTLKTTLKSMHFIPSIDSIDDDDNDKINQRILSHSVMRAIVLPIGKLGISFFVHGDHVVISDVKADSNLLGVLGVGDVVIGIDELGIGGDSIEKLVKTLKERERRDGRLLRVVSCKSCKVGS